MYKEDLAFNAKFCFYMYIKYMICKYILKIHTVECQTNLFLTIQFIIGHMFAVNLNVRQFYLTHRWVNIIKYSYLIQIIFTQLYGFKWLIILILSKGLIWFSHVSWHINPCGLFNAKAIHIEEWHIRCFHPGTECTWE